MITTTISDFKKDIKKYLDSVTKNFETLIINRGKDTGVVVISLEEYNSLTAAVVFSFTKPTSKVKIPGRLPICCLLTVG